MPGNCTSTGTRLPRFSLDLVITISCGLKLARIEGFEDGFKMSVVQIFTAQKILNIFHQNRVYFPRKSTWIVLHSFINPLFSAAGVSKRADRKDVGEAGRPHGTEEGVDVGESVLY